MEHQVREPRRGAREIALGGLLWSMLLVILLAVISFPELGGWSGWLVQTGR
jgi:hypothetical protein